MAVTTLGYVNFRPCFLQRMVIVLTQKRIVRQGGYEYHIPPGSVIGTKHLPVKHTFNPGKDAKLVADPGNEHKPGDVLAA